MQQFPVRRRPSSTVQQRAAHVHAGRRTRQGSDLIHLHACAGDTKEAFPLARVLSATNTIISSQPRLNKSTAGRARQSLSWCGVGEREERANRSQVSVSAVQMLCLRRLGAFDVTVCGCALVVSFDPSSFTGHLAGFSYCACFYLLRGLHCWVYSFSFLGTAPPASL